MWNVLYPNIFTDGKTVGKLGLRQSGMDARLARTSDSQAASPSAPQTKTDKLHPAMGWQAGIRGRRGHG
jgi:hypothetical protein